MALAWGGIAVAMGAIGLWGGATSEGLALQALLVLFGVTMVAFGAQMIYYRDWPTRVGDD